MQHAEKPVRGGDPRRWARPATACLAWAVLASPAGAQTDGPSATFDEALRLGGAVPAAEAPARALEARGDGELSSPGTTSQPQLSVYGGPRFSGGDDRGIDVQATLSQSWSLAGLAHAHRDAARREREALSVEARARRLAHRIDAAHAWIARHTLERRRVVVEVEEQAARGLADAVARARAVGERTRADEARARAYVAEVRLHSVDLEGAEHDAGLMLSLRLGRDDGIPVAAAGAAPRPELPDAALREALEARVGSMPAARSLRLAALAARARGAEQRAAYAGATVNFGVSFQHEAPVDNVGFLIAGVSLPVLPIARRIEAAAASEAARSEADADQARLDARMHLAEAWHEVEHTGEVEATVRNELVPALEEDVAMSEALVAAGEGTVWELLDARYRLAEARDRLVVAEGDHLWARVRAWMLYAELAR